ncbi:MAG: zinc-ribbon domain-containing protein [bacterium]
MSARNKFCSNCGAPVAAGNVFCGKCGTRVHRENRCLRTLNSPTLSW